MGRGTPPQGRLRDHDHSRAGEGGSSLDIAELVVDLLGLDDNDTLDFGTDDDVSVKFDPAVGPNGALVIRDEVNNADRLELRVGEVLRLLSENLDVNGLDIVDGGTTIWDAAAAQIPEARVEQGPNSGLDADTVDGQQASALGGGLSPAATVTGQEGLYTFTASVGGTRAIAGSSGNGVIETRSGSFSAGTLSVTNRQTGAPRDWSRTVLPNAPEYLYLWAKDLSTVTGGAATPGVTPRDLTWDGSRFILGDVSADYLYELDSGFNVTGGTSGEGHSVAWDGSKFVAPQSGADYLYVYDSSLSLTGGQSSPAQNPRGIAWDGSQSRFVHTDDNAGYIYELDSDLNVTGGTIGPNGEYERGLTWDGTRFLMVLGNGEIYELDEDFSTVARTAAPGPDADGIAWDGSRYVHTDPTADYFYEFEGGAFDFTAGVIS